LRGILLLSPVSVTDVYRSMNGFQAFLERFRSFMTFLRPGTVRKVGRSTACKIPFMKNERSTVMKCGMSIFAIFFFLFNFEKVNITFYFCLKTRIGAHLIFNNAKDKCKRFYFHNLFSRFQVAFFLLLFYYVLYHNL